MPRHFEFTENNSSKFWEIELSGSSFTTWWGKIGTDGMSKTKEFSSDAEAKLEYDKIVAEKVKKGYVETGVATSSAKPAPAAAAPKPAPVASSPKPAPAASSANPAFAAGSPSPTPVASAPKPVSIASSSNPAPAASSPAPAPAASSSNPAPAATVSGASAAKSSSPAATASDTAAGGPAAGAKSLVAKALNLKSSSQTGDGTLPAHIDVRKMINEMPSQIKAASPKYWENPYYSDAKLDVMQLPAVAPVLRLSPEQQAPFLFEVLKALKAPTGLREVGAIKAMEQLAVRLLKRDLPFNENQLLTLLELTFQDYPSDVLTGNSVLSTVEKFADSNDLSESVIKKLKQLEEKISKGNRYYSQGPDTAGKKLIHRIDMILKRSDGGEEPIPIADKEAWSDQAIADLKALDAQARKSWLALLNHCGKISGTTPSGTWSKKANELVSAVGKENFVELVHKWFSLVPKKGTREGEEPGGWGVQSNEILQPQNVETLKGLAFACAGRADARLAGALGDAAESSFKKVTGQGPRAPKLGTACVHSLATMNTKESIAQLTRVQAKAKHASVKTQIEKALGSAATKSGMSVDDLQDLGVPDFGMQEVGKLVHDFGTWTAAITIDDSNTISLSWVSVNGKMQASVPSEVKKSSADKVKELTKITKDLEKLLPGLRSRMERSYIDQRHWRYGEWCDRFLNHPVTGTLARRLLWNFNSRAGIWFQNSFVDQSGKSFTPEDGSLVELWHPIGAEPNVVLHWRKWLAENQIVQPFKQCHREIYVLTDAEVQTSTYSNRFAGHILKQHQLQHLCLQRGWQYQLMGTFDSQSTPTLTLPRWEMAVELFIDIPMNSNEAGIFTTVASDKVQFLRLKNGQPGRYSEIPLSEIMPVVFSEVMRDVDLFISVCSIGTDPNWTEGYGDYWRSYSFGDLGNTAVIRKQVLEDLIPCLKIAPRCAIEGNFLKVRGELRNYKIHIGSANIMMEPNDQYLCIVAARGLSSTSEKVFLPFEGDTVLSLILSKAFLLAEDTKIKDESILSQIRM